MIFIKNVHRNKKNLIFNKINNKFKEINNKNKITEKKILIGYESILIYFIKIIITQASNMPVLITCHAYFINIKILVNIYGSFKI